MKRKKLWKDYLHLKLGRKELTKEKICKIGREGSTLVMSEDFDWWVKFKQIKILIDST